MKKLKNLYQFLGITALLFISVNAQAVTVVNTLTNGPDTDILCRNNPDPNLVQNCWTAGTSTGHNFILPDTGNADLLADTAFGSILGNLDLLYKAESGDDNVPTVTPAAEEGSLQGSYTTSFIFDALDIGDGYTGAIISHNGGPSVDCTVDCFLVIKDGNHNPAAYLFNLALGWDPLGANGGQPTTSGPAAWNGIMDLQLAHFWDEANGSISHLSLYGKTVSAIPVPGAIWLFGTALLGFVGVARSTRI